MNALRCINPRADDDAAAIFPPLIRLAEYFSVDALKRAAAAATDDEILASFETGKTFAPFLKAAVEIASGRENEVDAGRELIPLPRAETKAVNILAPIGTLKDIRRTRPYTFDALDVGYLTHMVSMFGVLSYRHHKDRIDRLAPQALLDTLGMLWPGTALSLARSRPQALRLLNRALSLDVGKLLSQ